MGNRQLYGQIHTLENGMLKPRNSSFWSLSPLPFSLGDEQILWINAQWKRACQTVCSVITAFKRFGSSVPNPSILELEFSPKKKAVAVLVPPEASHCGLPPPSQRPHQAVPSDRDGAFKQKQWWQEEGGKKTTQERKREKEIPAPVWLNRTHMDGSESGSQKKKKRAEAIRLMRS